MLNNYMREKILDLRSQGKTYNEISKILNCARSTVCYHLDKSQREKIVKRTSYYRSGGSPLLRRDIPNHFKRSIRNFQRRCSKNIPLISSNTENFSYEDAYDKFVNNQICYLTGRKIDLNDASTYMLDHIIPFSKGGKNTLDNLGICCPQANMAKHDLELDDFFILCEEILNYREKCCKGEI